MANILSGGQCRMVRYASDKCAFVRTNCPDHEDGLFSYLQFYYCSLADAKAVAFIALIVWLCLLFNTIGIAASDFLCIDLSTLASAMGLSESLTGVTFLAFGNGSPDVFSTFAAMRSNSGSLAIGELIGAATFITSVVAGSMALVRPFKVARRSFVRDVGFFIVAVAFSMGLTADGRIHAWESATMVALYLFYVVMVVSWHWYLVRQRRSHDRTLAARSHFHIPENQELDIEEPAEDDDPGVGSESRSLLHGSTEDFDALERSGLPAWKDGDEDDETRNRYLAEIRDNMHVYRPNSMRRNTALNPIRPSLVGALEFQSILSTLERSRNTHQRAGIDMDRYSDGGGSQDLDTRSIASHSQVYDSSNRRSPESREESSRTRAVSVNDAAGLRLDTSIFGQNARRPVQVTVSSPSGEEQASAVDQNPPHPAPEGARWGGPDLLAPSDAFQVPSSGVDANSSRSLSISPRGTVISPAVSPGAGDDDPSSPFPAFFDETPSPVVRQSSDRQRTSSSPTERMQVRDGASESGDNPPLKQVKWWPYWMLPAPQLLFSTLFPTLCDWKVKSILERVLGFIAAPTVFLLTITIPVVEPAPSDTTVDPIPIMVTSADDDGDQQQPSPRPRVRLPEDSPLLQAMDSSPIDGRRSRRTTIENGHSKAHYHGHHGRRRFDSELPPAVQLPDPDSSPAAAAAAAAAKEWNQWLVSIQLFMGAFFIALISWTTFDPDYNPRNLVLPTLIGLICSLASYALLRISVRQSSSHLSHPPKPWRPLLALFGFVVAICWIATIATEVVNLLKAMGVILNISDSLLGLTIFAVGNSLGDLVADITVARLGYPVMALSACFGGPMMNILLGIGLGGLYMTLSASSAVTGDWYHIKISKVLVISTITLLVILVGLLLVVPLNGWRMDRRIGWGLMVLWLVSTLGNVIAEVIS